MDQALQQSQQMAQPAPGATPDQALPQGQATTPGQPGAQIPPQVLEAFAKASLAAMKLIYSKPETVQQILAMVKAADTPEQGIMQAAKLIQGQLAQSSKGGQAVIERMLKPIAALIAELAATAGILKGPQQQGAPDGNAPPAEAPPAEAPPAGAEGGGLVQQAMGG